MAPLGNASFNEAIQEQIAEYGVVDVGVNEQGTVITNHAAGTDVFASAEQVIQSMIPAGHRLPNKILYKLISHMGPASLSVAAQVNNDWKSRVIPLLYQNIQISVGDDGFGGNARQILRTLMSTQFLSGKGVKAVKDCKRTTVDKTALGLIKSITLGSVSVKIKAQVPVVVAPPTAVSDEESCLSVNELELHSTKSGCSQTAVSVPEAPNAGTSAVFSTTEMQLITTAVQSLPWIDAQDGPWDTNTFITSSPLIAAKQAAWHTELASGDSSSARNLIVALCSNTIESIKIIESDNHEDGIDGAFPGGSGGIGLDLLNTGSRIRKIGDAIVSPVTFPIGNIVIYGAFANLKEVVIQETRSRGRQHNADAYGKLVSSEGSSVNLNYLAASSITKVVLTGVDFGAVASTGLTEPAFTVTQLIITDPLADVGATQISVAKLFIKCVFLKALVLGGCGRTAAQLASTIGSLALDVKRLHVFNTAGKHSRTALPGHGTHILRDLNKLE